MELIQTTLKNIWDTNALSDWKAAKEETQVSGDVGASIPGGEDADASISGGKGANVEGCDTAISREEGSSSSEDSMDSNDSDNKDNQRQKKKYSAVQNRDEDGEGKKQKKRKVNLTSKSTGSCSSRNK